MKYKHKTNGQIITLIEMNEKSKTVIVEKENGKTESMTTSTLKRWYEQIEDEVDFVKDIAEKVDKEVSEKDIIPTLNTVTQTDYLADALEIFNNYKCNLIKGKNGIAVYINNKRVLEVYIKNKTQTFDIFMAENLYSSYASDIFSDVTINPKFKLTHFVKKTSLNQLNDMLTLLADRLREECETIITKAVES